MLRTSLLLRSIFLLILSAIGLSQLSAQQIEVLSDNGNTQNEFSLLKASEKTIELNFQLNSYWMSEVQTPKGIENVINAMGSAKILKAGAPDLPKFSTSMIIPDKAKMDVRIVNSEFIEIANVEVAPSKGNLLRNVNPEDVPYKYGEVYSKDAFFPNNIADLQKPFIVRDFRGEALWLYPIQYNPVQKTLRIYTSIELEVFATDGQGENVLSRTKSVDKISREFHEIYKHQFINYDVAKYDPVTEEGNMLIICHDEWTNEMQPLVDWKKTIGRPTEMVTVTEAGGTAAAIATYVENYYNTNGLAYLLLVGDAAQVPTNSGSGLGGDSDNAYAYISGDDHYLEFFVGRFSAESAADVATQVNRTLTYENGNTLSSGWLNNTMGITSQEGTGDDDEYDYEHYLNMATDLLSFTYTNSLDLFDGSQGGNDEPGNPTPTMVASELNAGVGIINYTGHGSTTTWVSSGFSNSDVDGLMNDDMLPFIWSVACVNGAFDGQTCFGEAWMRATNGGSPTGAIGIFASTINQSWAPPMAGQDEMVDILVESYADNIKRTYGGLSVNGCHLMNDEYADFDMTDTWTIFGDPSLLVRTDDPVDMSVSYNAALLIGQESFTVNCGTEGALVSLTVDGEILGTATVTGGVATVNFPSPTTPGTMTVAVTGFNKKTHIGTVEISPANEPYVVLNSHGINDAAGNGNGEADYGESILLDVVLENVAEAGSGYDAANVEAVLSTTDTYVTITDSTETVGTIAAGNSTSIADAYELTIADNIPDQHPVTFNLVITGDDAKYTWESTFNIVVNAPDLSVGVMTIDDTGLGNGDNILDPGETANLVLTINNQGAADIDNVNSAFTINSGSEYMTLTSNTANVGAIAAGGSVDATFEATADAATPLGTPVDLTNNVTGGASDQYAAAADKQVIIGFVPEYCESGATSSSDSDLTLFEFGDLSNNTDGDCGQYDDFTEDPALVHEFMIGATYDVSVGLGTCGGTYTKGAKVFVDWNYDGDFDDAGETAFEVTPEDNEWTATGTITIPADAPAGQKFVRVVVRETSSLDNITPCGTFSWGGTEDYKIILVAPNPPVADFEATPTQTTEGMSVAFTDLTTNAPTAWDWTITPGTAGTDFEFVEGTDNTSQNPVVQFNTANSYTVELTATNLVDSDTETKTDYITINEVTDVPVANFEADATEIYPGEVVHFTDMSTNTPTGWQWTVTPGTAGTEFEYVETTSSTSQNPAIQFNTPGYYTIELVASNGIGDSDPYSVTDMINVLPVFYMQDGSVTTCNGIFFDTGGPDGDYSSDEMLTYTIYPAEAGKVSRVDFVALETESGYDYLTIYDGEDATATQIGTYDGINDGLSVIATNATGALTFVFDSDGMVTKPGWEANISCVTPGNFLATFTVTDANSNPIEGANININSTDITTDVNGVATTDLADGTYDYTVSAAGYYDTTGSITISGADVTEDVALDMEMYMVTFEVTADDAPAEGATISCPGVDPMTTDVNGEASMEMQTGTHDYTVSMDGYDDINGTFDVIDGPVTVPVNMVGINGVQTANLKLYPNPNKGTFHIEVSGTYDITVMNAIGRTIHTQKVNGQATINMDNASEGIYFIKLQDGNNVETQRFIISR